MAWHCIAKHGIVLLLPVLALNPATLTCIPSDPRTKPGEGDIFAASPAQLGVRTKDPSAAGGHSSFEAALATSTKKTGLCPCGQVNVVSAPGCDETSGFDYGKRQAQQQRRLQQQEQPQGAGKTTVRTNLQRTYDPSNAQQKQQRPAAGGRVRMPTGHGHSQGQLGATVFGCAIRGPGRRGAQCNAPCTNAPQ